MSDPWAVGNFQKVMHQGYVMELTPSDLEAAQKCRTYLDNLLQNQNKVMYGINTGFGSLCHTIIPKEELAQLQVNLLRSHACGTGEIVPLPIVRLMLHLKILSLLKGNSGVQTDTIQRLLLFFNRDWLPVIYTQGSLGASGDLAPLAHLALPLIGEGELWVNGERIDAHSFLKSQHIQPITLASKEGLALINGTQFMTAYGIYILELSQRLVEWADVLAALACATQKGRTDAFEPLTHLIRPHAGQIKSASTILNWLQGYSQTPMVVQDPYSIRCAPQVHGASRGVIQHVSEIFETEINGVSDNPNIFPDLDRVVSAGNFHGQPLALALDYLSIALHELGNISERRIYLYISGSRGLPPFLTTNPGIQSGFMIPQYTAASIVSQNKQYCTPASADSITSSNGQEDHVSMGANAAVKTLQILENVQQILGIELLNGSQAAWLSGVQLPNRLEKLVNDFRMVVPVQKEDTILSPLMHKAKKFIKDYKWNMD